MSYDYGLSEGIKSVSGAMNSAREATKSLTHSIEATQKDATDVALLKAQERMRAQREAEFRKQTAIIKALNEYNKKKLISDQEAKLRIDFVKKYGGREWEEVLRIKKDIEAMEKSNSDEFQHDLKAVRRVQMYCWILAALVAWYLTWGIK
jgi:hypothetical protein